MKKHLIALAALLALAVATAAQGQEAPLQADVRINVKASRPIGAIFRGQLDPGSARFRGNVFNLPGGDTALVTLRFDYRIPEGTIAFDEIIDRLVISVEDAAGATFATAAIDPNTVNLNPNRVPLHYSATLYIPEDARRNGYFVRVRVFGNYE